LILKTNALLYGVGHLSSLPLYFIAFGDEDTELLNDWGSGAIEL
jgi:hypothetical protein